MAHDPPLLGERFDKALIYASVAHREQQRKLSGIPYVAHLLGVCAIALENGADEDQAIAALLHDAVEDQGGAARLAHIRKTFGDTVAQIVADCSDDDATSDKKVAWRKRKETYLASLAAKPMMSLEVSLADKTHNATAVLEDLSGVGPAIWDRFTGSREDVLWYYQSLAAAFQEHCPGPGADRLARVVDQLEALAGEDTA